MTVTLRKVRDFDATGFPPAAEAGAPCRIERGVVAGDATASEDGTEGTTMTCWQAGQLICDPE